MIFTRIELFWWMVAANLAGRCVYELIRLIAVTFWSDWWLLREPRFNKPTGLAPRIEP